MLLKLLVLFVCVPLIELALLLTLAKYTSLVLTLLVVVVTGVAGTLLARAQGWQTFQRIQRETSQGNLPTDSLIDAAMIFCAGALLLTPGLLTDAFGLSLLIPTFRKYYRAGLLRWVKRHFKVEQFDSSGAGANSEIIDSYVVQQQPDQPDGESPPR